MLKKIRRILGLEECKRLNVPLWECPSFLFLLLGIINILSCLFFYFVGQRYIENIEWVVFGVLILAAIWFVISFAVTRGLEELMEVNRIKEDFINILAHQLRTPLTNLKWTVQFLTSKTVGQKSDEEYFNIIKENSQRLENLLNDLLVMARIKEKGIFHLKENFSLSELIFEVIRNQKPFADASNISIEFEDAKEPIFLSTNRTMLKTVLINLLENAIIYNKPNGKVKISIKKEPKNLLICVEDTGVGIPKEDQKYIFQKFFRGKNASQLNTRGTGLGLYIVKEITEKLQGKVWFKSQPQKGTAFFVALPLKIIK